jgi:hypothetical protein
MLRFIEFDECYHLSTVNSGYEPISVDIRLLTWLLPWFP